MSTHSVPTDVLAAPANSTPPSAATTATAILDIASYLEELSTTIQRLPVPSIHRLAEVFLGAYTRQQTIFLFGNGGSASLASHLCCDLGKGTIPGAGGGRLRAVALTDNVALITAWANDTRYEGIFCQQLASLMNPGDVAFAISASGNSPNVLAALDFAQRAGMITAGISGFQGGKMKSLCQVCVVVPSENMQIIEDLHLSIAHAVWRVVRQKMASPCGPAAREASRELSPSHLEEAI
jgi:D-sedoheptulose 7-phosphate isomerase